MTSEKVVRSYYAIAGLYTLAASVIWGVNTLFLLDAGLSFLDVFIANAAFSAGMVIFEIPTGVVADTMGRRTSFLFSVTVLAATTLLYVWLAHQGAGVVAFSIVSVFMGLGFTFYSGAVEAWLVDALNSTGYDGLLDRVFARGQMVTGVAMLIGTVLGGVLGQVDLAIPFAARAGLLIGLFGYALRAMRDIGFTPRRISRHELPAEMASVAQASIAFGWRERPIRLLIAGSTVTSGFIIWAFYAWQPYFLDLLQRDAVWIAGVISALISISTIIGNALDEWLTRFCGRRTTLMAWAAGVQTVAAIGVGLTTSFWIAVPLFLLITTAMGVMWPVRQAFIHGVIPSEQRATVISFDSMVSGVGGVGGQLGLGTLGQVRSISSGFVVGGAATVLAVPILLAVRKLGHPADLIVGTRAGVEGTCAAHGTPAIGQTESQPREFATTS